MDKTLAFTGQRNGEFDIYTILASRRARNAADHRDGPRRRPGIFARRKYIYFNSERTGTMQIWRMNPDGNGQEQVTNDEWNNWFPHISPDGKWMVILVSKKM